MSNSKAVISSPELYDADQLDQAEYQALEAALLQTARGRGFLNEYLRRNGVNATGEASFLANGSGENAPVSQDADRILQAVENLHKAVMQQQQNPVGDHARMDILEMAKAIARTRSEISAMRTDGDYDHLSVASEEMDAIVLSTEKATNDILQAAEKIQEVAWRLREKGADEEACEEIDNNATDIYMACSFQDLTGQRTTKVVRVLQYLEARINSMIEIWGLSDEELQAATVKKPEDGPAPLSESDTRPDAHLLNGPQQDEEALGQDNIDALLGEGDFASVDVGDDPLTMPVASDASEKEAGEATDVPSTGTQNDEIIDEEQLKALFS